MSPQEAKAVTGRLGAMLIAGLFVVVGMITLYDTTTYGDLDAKVFPRAAAIVLIVCSLIIVVTNLLRPVREPGFAQGVWWRRLLLVASMLIAALIMPRTGFLPAGFIVFAGSMLAARHERWSLQSFIRYSGSGIIIVVGFYALFRFVLNVPLP